MMFFTVLKMYVTYKKCKKKKKFKKNDNNIRYSGVRVCVFSVRD